MARINGTQDGDLLNGSQSKDEIWGNGGDDVISGFGGADTIHGGDGNDTIDAGDGDDPFVNGDAGDDTIHGGNGNDYLGGGDGNDWVFGDAGNDTVFGDGGDDHLFGGDGNDAIMGFFGADEESGGSGADTFVYAQTWYSTANAYISPELTTGIDTITDFQTGIDKIDLSQIDADNSTAVHQVRQKGSVVEVGNESFTYHAVTAGYVPGAGDLTVTVENGMTVIRAYTDADATPDLELHVIGNVTLADIYL